MNKVNTKEMQYPFLITLAGTTLLLAMLLLPYASATDDYKEFLTENKDDYYLEEINMTNSEAVNLSLVEFIRMYVEAVNQEVYTNVGISFIVMITMFAVFAGVTLLLTLCKKPVGIIIFNLFAMGIFRLIQICHDDIGFIPSKRYDWGIVSYLTYFIGIVIVIGAVWLFIEKRKAKKMAKPGQKDPV